MWQTYCSQGPLLQAGLPAVSTLKKHSTFSDCVFLSILLTLEAAVTFPVLSSSLHALLSLHLPSVSPSTAEPG